MTTPLISEYQQPDRHDQPPLMKQRLMAWLQDQGERGLHGHDTLTIARSHKVAPGAVNRTLWDLQKQGLVTFRERKRLPGGDSGHMTDVLDHISVTPQGRSWNREKSVLADIAPEPYKTEDMNPDFVAQVDADEVAQDMRLDALKSALQQMSPMQAVVALLRGFGGPIPVRRANAVLGYTPLSTALYSLAKSSDGRVKVKSGKVLLTPKAEGWEPKDERRGVAGRSRTKGLLAQNILSATAVMAEAEASVALDHDPEYGTHSVGDGHDHEEVVSSPVLEETTPGVSVRALVAIDLAGAYPQISALMEREGKRQKVAEAVAALEAAGLDDDALTVMGRIPDDSALEREVISLVKELRHG